MNKPERTLGGNYRYKGFFFSGEKRGGDYSAQRVFDGNKIYIRATTLAQMAKKIDDAIECFNIPESQTTYKAY